MDNTNSMEIIKILKQLADTSHSDIDQFKVSYDDSEWCITLITSKKQHIVKDVDLDNAIQRVLGLLISIEHSLLVAVVNGRYFYQKDITSWIDKDFVSIRRQAKNGDLAISKTSKNDSIGIIESVELIAFPTENDKLRFLNANHHRRNVIDVIKVSKSLNEFKI